MKRPNAGFLKASFADFNWFAYEIEMLFKNQGMMVRHWPVETCENPIGWHHQPGRYLVLCSRGVEKACIQSGDVSLPGSSGSLTSGTLLSALSNAVPSTQVPAGIEYDVKQVGSVPSLIANVFSLLKIRDLTRHKQSNQTASTFNCYHSSDKTQKFHFSSPNYNLNLSHEFLKKNELSCDRD